MPAKVCEEIAICPRITLLEGFLSPEECQHLIHLGEGLLAPSQVYPDGDGALHTNSRLRDSSSSFLPIGQTPMLADIERRIAALVNLPTLHGESMQLLNYQVGQYYSPHIDFFAPTNPSCKDTLAYGGQRIATCLLYLNTPKSGGETHFVKHGIKIVPIQGNAVLFYNVLPNGEEDWSSLHASIAVTEGEKWVATKWIREKPQR